MRFVIIAAVVLSAGQSFATDAVELSQFLEAADQQNIDRRMTAEVHKRSVAEFRQAWTSLLPSLSASASWTHNQYEAAATLPNGMGGSTKLVIQPFDQFDGVLRFDLPLVDTTRWFRAMAADIAQDGASARELQTSDLVKRQIVASYYGFAAALALRESAAKSLAAAEAQAKVIEIRANAGAVTNLDLLRAKAEVQRNRQTQADALNLVAVSKRTLQTLSGLTPADNVKLPVANVAAEPALEELESRIGELPAVKAADLDRAAAQKISQASKLALVPTLGAQYTQRFTNATGFQGQSTLYNLGLNLNWRLDVPTFQAMAVQDSNATVASLAAEKARLQARDQVHSDWQALQAARIKIEAAEAQVQAAQKAAEVARDRYTAGSATQVEVIQSERDLFGAEVGQIQARTSLAQARASLHLSAALPLQ